MRSPPCVVTTTLLKMLTLFHSPKLLSACLARIELRKYSQTLRQQLQSLNACRVMALAAKLCNKILFKLVNSDERSNHSDCVRVLHVFVLICLLMLFLTRLADLLCDCLLGSAYCHVGEENYQRIKQGRCYMLLLFKNMH